MRTVKIGLCGFSVAIQKYSLWFPVAEVQQTFYQPSSESVMRRWRSNTPSEMEFTIKAWQLITHTAASPTYRRLKKPLTARQRAAAGAFGNTAIVEEGWGVTMECARILGASSILFQCPASFKPTDENVANFESFFKRIKRPAGVKLLWEPRGPWPRDLVVALCASHQLTHVVDPFVTETVTKGTTYYRLHGISGARHVFSDHELVQLREMLPSDGETYVLFNNIPRVADALRFGRLLGEGLVPGAE